MGLMVNTIFKWVDPDKTDDPDYEGEECQDGQCVGIVTKLTDKEGNDNPPSWCEPDIYVKWYEMCPKHAYIDPDGTGPYKAEFIWQIGQLY